MFTNKELFRLIVPLMIELVLAVTVGMADVMMISVAGEAAVSGVSLVDMVNVLIINLFAALATGGAVVSAQCIGKKDRDMACESAHQLLLVTVIISLLLMVFVLVAKKPLLRLLFGTIDDKVMKNALTYMTITALSYPFLALYQSCSALFRSMGNSRISMVISFFMNIINIGGNAVCIFLLHMGIAGVAVPSLISRGIAAVVMLVIIRNPKNQIYIGKEVKLHINWVMIRKILHIGIPNGLENSLFQLGRVLVVSIIAGFGTIEIAANAVANNFDALGYIPAQALGLTMIAVVGQCVGCGDYEQARFYTKKLMKISFVSTAVVNGIILLTLPFTLQIYHLSEETLKLAAILILIHDGCGILLIPPAFTLPNALRASNDVKFTMVWSIFSMWTFRIGASFIFAKFFGLGALGVWIAMIMDWIFRTICFVLRFRGNKWQLHQI